MRKLLLLCLIATLALAACDRLGATPTATLPAASPTALAAQPSNTVAPPSATLPAASDTPAPPTTTAPDPATATASPIPASPTATGDGCAARHTVQAGERLFRIGLLYGVEWTVIAQANNLSDPSLIYPGQVLCIPGGGGAPGGVPSATAPPSASATAPANPTQGPTATATLTASAAAAAILTFAAYPPSTGPGGTITLAWTTSGGVSASLIEPVCCASNGGNLSREVPVNGSAKASTSSAVERDTLVYTLLLNGSAGSSAIQSVQVPLTCPDTYFFTAPPGTMPCPASAPVRTQAAEQLFEHGRMIWLQATGTILVLFDDGTPPNGPGLPPDSFVSFPDTWTPDEPESDPDLIPPAGRYQPVRGFGKVWQSNLAQGQTVRGALGWATAPEQPYSGVVQRPWKTCLSADAAGAVTSCSGPAQIQFLQSADGRLIRAADFGALERHTVAQWQFWTPGTP